MQPGESIQEAEARPVAGAWKPTRWLISSLIALQCEQRAQAIPNTLPTCGFGKNQAQPWPGSLRWLAQDLDPMVLPIQAHPTFLPRPAGSTKSKHREGRPPCCQLCCCSAHPLASIDPETMVPEEEGQTARCQFPSGCAISLTR